MRRVRDGSGRALPSRPRRPLDGAAFYTALPWVVAGELRSFRPDVVIAESVFEAAAVELAVRLARSRALVVAEVHGDWRVGRAIYGSRARALLRPASNAVAAFGADHADGHRAVSGFTASMLESRGQRRSASSRRTPTSRPSASRAWRSPRTRASSSSEYWSATRTSRGSPRPGGWSRPRMPEAELRLVGQGTLTEVAEGLAPAGARWDRRLEPPDARPRARRRARLLLPSASEGLPQGRDRGVRPRPRRDRDARGRDPRPRRGRWQRVPGRLGDTAGPAHAIERVVTDHELAVRLGAAAAEASARWVRRPTTTPERAGPRRGKSPGPHVKRRR